MLSHSVLCRNNWKKAKYRSFVDGLWPWQCKWERRVRQEKIGEACNAHCAGSHSRDGACLDFVMFLVAPVLRQAPLRENLSMQLPHLIVIIIIF
jgi:hypothetical protein